MIATTISRKNELIPTMATAVFSDVVPGIHSDCSLAAKSNVDWTKRLLRYFLVSADKWLIKIDPDTFFTGEAPIPEGCDVAGDFRKTNAGNIFLGGFQFFTRRAAELILADSQYAGACIYQDVALAHSIRRLRLRCFNMPCINSWRLPEEPETQVWHPGKSKLARLPLGQIHLEL